MSGWESDVDYYQSLDGPQVAYNAQCVDCGDPVLLGPTDVGKPLCDTCGDQRDAHASALEIRMATSTSLTREVPAVVEVALVPIHPNVYSPVVDVALVPVDQVRDLKRMAKAILSADLTQIREVA